MSNDYPARETEASYAAARNGNVHSNSNNNNNKSKKKTKNDKQNSIIKLPFLIDRLARDTARIVRCHFRDVR